MALQKKKERKKRGIHTVYNIASGYKYLKRVAYFYESSLSQKFINR